MSQYRLFLLRKTKFTILLLIAFTVLEVPAQGSILSRMRDIQIAKEKEAFNTKYPLGTNEYGKTFDQQRQAHEAKYANLKIDGVGPYKFGDPEKNFSYAYIAEKDGGGVHVNLKEPIRHFTSVSLSYTADARKLFCISLVADARGVSEEDLMYELKTLKSIIENKYGIEFKREANGNGYSFETSKYQIRLRKCSWYIPALELSVTAKQIEDTIQVEWEHLKQDVDIEKL